MHTEFDSNSTHWFKRPHRHRYKKETVDLLKVFYLGGLHAYHKANTFLCRPKCFRATNGIIAVLH